MQVGVQRDQRPDELLETRGQLYLLRAHRRAVVDDPEEVDLVVERPLDVLDPLRGEGILDRRQLSAAPGHQADESHE